MKNLLQKTSHIAVSLVAVSSVACANAEKTEEEVGVFDSYTCSNLVALDYEVVPTAIYYIEGYTDSEGDEEVDVDEEFTVIPVEKVYTYCIKNPDELVVDVIEKHDDED